MGESERERESEREKVKTMKVLRIVHLYLKLYL